MSELKPSIMKCLECGYEPNIITDVCIKCGGKVVKICGNCQAHNPVENNKCEKCNEILALTPQKKIDYDKLDKNDENKEKTIDQNFQENKDILSDKKTKLEFEPITDAITRKVSYRHKKKEEIFELKKIEEEKARIESFAKEKKYEDNKEIESKKIEQKEKNNIYTKNKRFLVGVSILVFLFLVIIYFFVIRKSVSKYNLIFTAKNYLTALKKKDYEKAYSYLSTNSRAMVSFNDYIKANEEYYSSVGEWDFKDVKIYLFNKDQSIVSYKLYENGEWKDDYLNFINERGVWVRPYVWNLFEEIEKAFNRNDYTTALYLSQKLYLIDPLDPRSSGNLCWSEYLMQLFDKSVESCRRTIELSYLYPVKYYNTEQIFWYKFNYADSLKFTGRVEEAINIFNSLISAPDVNLNSKCPVFMVRGGSYIEISRYEEAKRDFMTAINVCEKDLDKKEAQRIVDMLNGNKCEDVISFIKGYRYNGEKFINFLNTIIKSFDDKKNKYDVLFNCEHKMGPYYIIDVDVAKVSKNKKDIIYSYSFDVDLWHKKVELLKEEK